MALIQANARLYDGPSPRRTPLENKDHDDRAVAVERLADRVRCAVERDVQGRGVRDDADARIAWREHLSDAFRMLFEFRFGAAGEVATEREGLRAALARSLEDLSALEAEDLGRVYERLLPLTPGVAREPMVRLRRGELESVVPASEGAAFDGAAGSRGTRIRPVGTIASGRFFTCAGLERKSAGSYYTPRPLVEFLVGRALRPLVAERSPAEHPAPGALLKLTVLDPATGTGNFLCEACRVLGAALLRACQRRLADDPAAVSALPNGRRLVDWLAGDVERAERACREMVATHCLHGVDLDPLALEITRLALRAVCGWPGPEAQVPPGQLACGDALAGVVPAPGAASEGAGGFDAVVGNPPWEALRPRAKEFFARYDLRVLDAPTRRERRRIEARLERDPAVVRAREQYETRLRQQRRDYERRYRWQAVQVDGRQTGGDPDQWKLFMERAAQLVRPGGWVALLVPSAFHTNASATGVRKLYLERLDLRCCHSLHNRRGLFDIHRSFKFDAVVARRDDGGTRSFECSFHVQDPADLERHPLTFTRPFVARVGGGHLVFPELRTPLDVEVVEACYRGGDRLGRTADELGVHLRSSMHMTNEAHLFTPSAEALPGDGDPRSPDMAESLSEQGYLPLHEGKTFHQFDDRWGPPPRYVVHRERIGPAARRRAVRHYRLAYRAVASSTNERTGIFAVLPPGVLCGNSAPVEADPWDRPDRAALLLCALGNSHCVDYLMRVRSSANLNLFILRQTALPPRDGLEALLVHSALRLTCNHRGYGPLWRDQLGGAWRETSSAEPAWPVLPTPRTRLAVRAAVDAAVAHAFGLSRLQFEHVLSSFSHVSYPGAPAACLDAYDELLRGGAAAFARSHDPYADIPLSGRVTTASSDPAAGPVR